MRQFIVKKLTEADVDAEQQVQQKSTKQIYRIRNDFTKCTCNSVSSNIKYKCSAFAVAFFATLRKISDATATAEYSAAITGTTSNAAAKFNVGIDINVSIFNVPIILENESILKLLYLNKYSAVLTVEVKNSRYF